MKLKTFMANSIPEAMSEIRRVFGENAVIVSSFRTKERGVKLIVATEESPETSETPIQEELRKNEQRHNYFETVLKHRSLPAALIERFVGAVARKSMKTAEDKLLKAAVSELYTYKSIEPLKKSGLCVFAGSGGCGKTTAVAKIAWHAKIQKIKTALITLDTRKAGSVTELVRYAALMDMSCTVLSDWEQLNETVTMLRLNYDLILIDTPALNPYQPVDVTRLQQIRTQVADADMIYVQAAGMDCYEAQTQGIVFAKAGCTRMLVTKLDAAVSYGGFLQSALFSAYQFVGFVCSGKVTDYICAATPDNLVRLLKNGSVDGEEE